MYKQLSRTLVCLSLFLYACQKDVPEVTKTDDNFLSKSSKRKVRSYEAQSVRFIYLIPADRTFNKEYYHAVNKAARTVQRWYRDQMDKLTFRLNNPIVEVLYSDHTADWFSAYNGPQSGEYPIFYFFYNTYTEIQLLSGSQWDLSKYVFTVYVDAYGQTGAGATGMAFLPENDLKGLAGDMEEPVSRWIGGLGHELGHGFGLPHPPDGSSYWNTAIMGFGYITFPEAILTPADKEILSNSGFFFRK